MVNELIAGMAQRLGLSLELNDEGACRLVFEDKYTVDIQVQEGQENRFYFVSTVGQAEAPTEAQLRTLLDANLFGQGTGEAALAYARIWRKFCSSAVSMRDMSISAN
jgi:Tir chaperone protein (CesT) family